jgi:hypothetical protein
VTFVGVVPRRSEVRLESSCVPELAGASAAENGVFCRASSDAIWYCGVCTKIE